jgi:hypothetical protein
MLAEPHLYTGGLSLIHVEHVAAQRASWRWPSFTVTRSMPQQGERILKESGKAVPGT